MYEILEETQTQTIAQNGVSADYIVLLPQGVLFAGKKNYETNLCGAAVRLWVERACDKKPQVAELAVEEELFDTVRGMLKDAEYTVVLFADTPLITKKSVGEMLELAASQNANVLRFERAYIFKTEELKKQNLFASKTQEFAKNEMLKIDSIDALEKAQKILQNRIIKFHMANGVYFASPSCTYVDSLAVIEPGVIIEPFVKIEGNSFVGANSKICSNTIISASKIDERTIIKNGCNIIGSMIADSAIVGNNTCVMNKSVVGEESIISAGCTLDNASINKGSKVGINCTLVNTKIANNVNIGAGVKCLGSDVFDIKICSGATVGAGATICAGAVIKEDSNIAENACVKGK